MPFQIEVCQQILRNPTRLLQHAAHDSVWLLRVCKVLDACLVQLALPHSVQAIPLRMLETFTTVAAVERYVEDETVLYKYLECVFGFLITRNYFVRLRQLLDDKCPPLDGETLHAPTPFADALMQLMLRPLSVALRQPCSELSQLFSRKFICDILATPHTEPVRYFVLPCLAESEEFPYALLMHTLHALLDISEYSPVSEVAATDSVNTNNLFYGVMQAEEAGVKSSKAQTHDKLFSSYLLNSLLVLDRSHLGVYTYIHNNHNNYI